MGPTILMSSDQYESSQALNLYDFCWKNESVSGRER